jgi:hypothetical protein
MGDNFLWSSPEMASGIPTRIHRCRAMNIMLIAAYSTSRTRHIAWEMTRVRGTEVE